MKFRKFNLDCENEVHVVGILNVTPDSFSDGGHFFDNAEKAIDHAMQMAGEGASIIDIGGESSRPGSERISAEEEWRRIGPVLHGVVGRLRIPVSVDTMKAEIAYRAIAAGASMINDISAGNFDPEMIPVVAESDAAFVVMHMLGRPESMQQNPTYKNVVEEVGDFFAHQLELLKCHGVSSDRVLLDPGIGFGKSQDDNLKLLANLKKFQIFSRPILVGASRKSFISSVLQSDVHGRLEGSLAAAVASVLQGVSMIRAHDVGSTLKAVSMAKAIRLASNRALE